MRRLDKRKFIVVGAGMFSVSPLPTIEHCFALNLEAMLLLCNFEHAINLIAIALQGVTTCLFPLTVIKTRQMAIPGAPTGLLVSLFSD